LQEYTEPLLLARADKLQAAPNGREVGPRAVALCCRDWQNKALNNHIS
jgi:hypothetical protein